MLSIHRSRRTTDNWTQEKVGAMALGELKLRSRTKHFEVSSLGSGTEARSPVS